VRVLSVETVTHGRVLVEEPERSRALEDAAGPDRSRRAVPASRGWLVGFHGYGQSAEDMFAELQRLDPDRAWSIAAPQALHRFYTRGDERIVASWMTRQDRELAVADNVEYCNRLGSHLELPYQAGKAGPSLVFLGFSQGAAMAYRAAALGRFPARAVIALAGDIPPEVRAVDPATLRRHIGRVLIGAGTRDHWFTTAKADADASFLASIGVPHELVRFDGAHEWSDVFRRAARALLLGADEEHS
jgi:predicted esterase